MAQLKINYGIDLGTTNSSICQLKKGEPVIIKTDTLKDTLPSCVSINKNSNIRVGDSAFNTMKSDKRRATKSWSSGTSNTYIEFKRAMGTDTLYNCSNNNQKYTPEQLSSEVLKYLKSLVTDECIQAAVITVPAKFTVGQKTATLEAARLAGFKQCELLQEPIAAAFAYGLSSEQKDGIWMVFDFGGGTFDTALLKADDGILQVFDTAGDNYLGGKDLDAAIVEQLIIPYLKTQYAIDGILADKEKRKVLCDAMKTYAEEVKNQLSFKSSEDIISNIGELGMDENGVEIELDLTVSQQQLFQVIRPVFQKAIDICKSLLMRNKLSGNDLNKIILIGGPTYSPLIRQMLREQITPNVDSSINPMTAVATGAALYASTIDMTVNRISTNTGEVTLDLEYEATTAGTSEWVSIKLAHDLAFPNHSNSVQVELIRMDHAWSSGKTSIDRDGNVVEVNLTEGKSNTFSIVCYDETGVQLECTPTEFTIIQGTKVPPPPLPYNIGIATKNENTGKLVFTVAKGLEKNKFLPATGTINSLYTSKALRPGIASDILTIPVYQCEDSLSIERTASLYEYVADILVTGEEVGELIPENSLVDITLKVNTSEQMTMDIYFPVIDFTISKHLDTSKKQSVHEAENQIHRLMDDAQQSLKRLEDIGINTKKLKTELHEQFESGLNNPEKKAALQHLKETLRKIEEKDSNTEWIRQEKEIRDVFQLLELATHRVNNTIPMDTLQQLYNRRDQILMSKNIMQAKIFVEQVKTLYAQHNMLYICMGLIQHYSENFEKITWADSQRAQYLLLLGKEMMSKKDIKVEQLHPIALQIQELVVIDDKYSSFLRSVYNNNF